MKSLFARQIVSTAALVAAAVTLATFPGASAAEDGDIIGRVGGLEMKAAQVRAFVAGLDPAQQKAIVSNPVVLTQVVRQMLAQKLLLQEAAAKKWEKRPEVAAQLERARESAIAESYLSAVAKPPAEFPSESDLQEAYEANMASYLVPRQFELAQIFVALPQGADAAAEKTAKAKLDKIQKRLRGPKADFAAIATEDSDDRMTGLQGGKMGWVAETQLAPDIKPVVTGLPKGSVSEPLRLNDGWHFLKLLDTKPAGAKPLAEVRDQLIQQLRADRAQELRRAYFGGLLAKNPIAINELALQKLVVK